MAAFTDDKQAGDVAAALDGLKVSEARTNLSAIYRSNCQPRAVEAGNARRTGWPARTTPAQRATRPFPPRRAPCEPAPHLVHA